MGAGFTGCAFLLVVKPAAKSEVAEEVVPANAQAFGNPEKGVEGDPLLAAFDLAHIDRAQLRLFR